MSEKRYQGVVFDLLTALLDSWSLWNRVADSEEEGLAWRSGYIELTYQAGAYRPYHLIIEAAARDTGVSPGKAAELVKRWTEVEPWPEARQVLDELARRVPVAVATNASITLGRAAAASLDRPDLIVVTAEEAGFYKPDPRPYRMALDRLELPAESVLFVAGSPNDVFGASAVGMDVYWHNRRNLSLPSSETQPAYTFDSLQPLLDLVQGQAP